MAFIFNGTDIVGAKIGEPADASEVAYDNTTSGLIADNVQDAIDEIANGGGSGDISVVSDAWNSETQYVVNQYCIYDNVLYRCTNNNIGMQPDISSTYWVVTNTGIELGSVLNKLNVLFSNVKTAYINGVTSNTFLGIDIRLDFHQYSNYQIFIVSRFCFSRVYVRFNNVESDSQYGINNIASSPNSGSNLSISKVNNTTFRIRAASEPYECFYVIVFGIGFVPNFTITRYQ